MFCKVSNIEKDTELVLAPYYMHIAEMMFISNILLCQDPLSGGDQLQELPLAPHLQMGVEEVDIKSPPPSPLLNFIIICFSLLAS